MYIGQIKMKIETVFKQNWRLISRSYIINLWAETNELILCTLIWDPRWNSALDVSIQGCEQISNWNGRGSNGRCLFAILRSEFCRHGGGGTKGETKQGSVFTNSSISFEVWRNFVGAIHSGKWNILFGGSFFCVMRENKLCNFFSFVLIICDFKSKKEKKIYFIFLTCVTSSSLLVTAKEENELSLGIS